MPSDHARRRGVPRWLLNRLIILAFGLLGSTGGAFAGQVTLTWDAVSGASGYRLDYGTASRSYSANLDVGKQTTATVPGLTEGKRYYFAVKAYTTAAISGHSNEVSALIPATTTSSSASTSTPTTSPAAGAVTSTESVGIGAQESTNLALNRPVAVSSNENREWVGSHAVDGKGGTRWSSRFYDPQWLQVDLGSVYSINRVVLRWERAAARTYQIRVSLDGVNFTTPFSTTSGDGGVDDIALNPVSARYVRMYGTGRLTPYGYSLWELEVYGTASILTQLSGTEPDTALEVGEVDIDHQWRWVTLQSQFQDPIVVAGPLSGNGGDPAVVRVKGITQTGFWIRVQEWDYLDGSHAPETVSYLVMERGRHQLPDGAWIEADRLVTGATNNFVAQSFSEPLYETPVVFATVTSVNEADAVTTRLRNVSVVGFQVALQEQEANTQQHLPERIDYIAFEPSFGVVNGRQYEVGLLDTGLTDTPQTLLYQGAYSQAPLLLADLQSANDMDTANLRWRNRNEVSVELWASEETSEDSEVTHTTETFGYFLAISPKVIRN